MSEASQRPEVAAGSRIDRLQRGIAAITSAVLHLLLLIVLLHSSPPVITTTESAGSGSRVRVNFIGEPVQAEQPVETPQTPPSSQRPQPSRPPPASRVQSTLVDRSDAPVPPNTADVQDPETERRMRTEQAPNTPTQSPPRPRADSPPPSSRRRPETWTGRPPGLLEEESAPMNAGRERSPALREGRGRDATGNGPAMELGGYLVYYDVLSEERLRAWAAQGMTEISIPLPGTRYYMVCPLEIALKRGAGKCRPLDPDSPDMRAIGDARQAVTMISVYKQGELVWRGPGPYR